MNKKSNIAKSSWWIFAIVGVIIYLNLDFGEVWTKILLGALTGAFGGWILGLIIDYIINSLFYRNPIEETIKPISNQKSKPIVHKSSNHDNYKPKPNKYNSSEKEKNITEIEQIAKPIKKENLSDSVQENKKPISEIKRVNYKLNLSESETNFPILKIPNQNSAIRTHRFGSTKRRGFKEVSFLKAIEYFFSNGFEVSGNTRLNTGNSTRPYEPDIALIDKGKENIRIDIEIDEPYVGITRQPTHCIGDDINRDNYFKDRGWIVIRFSEYQIHTQEKKCLKFIAELIFEINSAYKIPNELKAISELDKEKVWDIAQAQQWEKVNYREKYLNHEFRILKEKKETLKRDFDEQEIEEEKQVNRTISSKEQISYNYDSNSTNKTDAFNSFSSNRKHEIIKGVGWGEIILGTTKEKVDIFLSQNGEITSKYDDCYFVEYQKFGIQINFSLNNQVQAIFFYNKDKGYEHMASYQFKTDKNIGWKSTITEIKEEYGFIVNHFKFKDGERIEFRGIDFRFLNKKLVRIGICNN